MFYTCVDIPSDISKLTEIEEFTDKIMHDCGITENLRGLIVLPLTEAVKNAIIHGNKENHGKKVHIICQQETGKLTFSVSDEGEGFHYEEYLNGGKTIHTHGIAVLRFLCNNITFQNNGSTIVFCINIPIKQNILSNPILIRDIKKHFEFSINKYESKY